MSFATPSDFYTLRGLPVPNPFTQVEKNRISALLDDAELQVRKMVRSGRYAVDSRGYPSDDEQARTFKLAVVDQALYFENNPRARNESSRDYDNVSFGSLSLGSNSSSASSSTKNGGRVDPRSARAIDRLIVGGLVTNQVGY